MPLLLRSLKTTPHTPADAMQPVCAEAGVAATEASGKSAAASGANVLQRPVEQLLGLSLELRRFHFLRHSLTPLGGGLPVVDARVFPSVRSVVRFLLANNHCISDPTAGVTQSLRTIMEWLAEAGHPCEILTTARFESAVTFTIDEHLRSRGVEVPPVAPRGRKSIRVSANANRPVVRYAVGRVPVSLLLTRHNDESRPDSAETRQYLALLDERLDAFAPTHLVACNGHPMIFEAMARAKRRAIATAFAVRGFGYYEPRYFEAVDHAFTCSQFLTDHYRDRVGLVSTPLEPPLEWSSVIAPPDARAFVTFVNPSTHKGLLLFARLADMLGSRRPDIPVLVVQSGPQRRIAERDSGSRFQQVPADHGGAARTRPRRLLRADPAARGAVGLGRTVRPRRRRSDGQRHTAAGQQPRIAAKRDRRRLRRRRTRTADPGVDDCRHDDAAERSGSGAVVRCRLRALGRSRAVPGGRRPCARDRRCAVQRNGVAKKTCRLLHLADARLSCLSGSGQSSAVIV